MRTSPVDAILSAEDQRFLLDLVRRDTGRPLAMTGESAIARRLPAVAATLGFADVRALMTSLRHTAAPPFVKQVCDALSSGEHAFFHGNAGIAAIRTALLPRAVAQARAARRPVRIWSAACANGQEAYSLAMLVADAFDAIGDPPVEIVASDYSAPTVVRAEAGIFSRFDVQRGLTSPLLVRHFTTAGDDYRVSDTLRARIQFAEQNLLAPLTIEGSFNIILMRHVLMYFDKSTKRDVVERVMQRLAPDGALLLGDGEHLRGVSDSIRRDRSYSAPIYRNAGEPVTPDMLVTAGV